MNSKTPKQKKKAQTSVATNESQVTSEDQVDSYCKEIFLEENGDLK